jgi:hypothetical protein
MMRLPSGPLRSASEDQGYDALALGLHDPTAPGLGRRAKKMARLSGPVVEEQRS